MVFQHVLTAYHCIAEKTGGPEPPDTFTVLMGDSDLRRIHQGTKLAEYGKRKVTQIDAYYSPWQCSVRDFDQICLRYDIAILTLDRAVDFTYSIRPILLWMFVQKAKHINFYPTCFKSQHL